MVKRKKVRSKTSPGKTAKVPPEAQPLLQYYELVFAVLRDRLGPDLNSALLSEPKRHRTAFWHQYAGQLLLPDVAWSALFNYAELLQRAIADIVSQHSTYYWLHLYRRIGVELHPGHEQKTDPTTTGLVRHTVEAAFYRYGQLPHHLEDIGLSSEVPPEEVLGGTWLDIHRERFKQASVDLLVRSLHASSQWVLTRFSESDFVNVFRVEGLAYEYWLTTARMRAVGKGSNIEVSASGEPTSARSSELEFLLQSFDARHSNQPLQSSAVGVAFGDTATPAEISTTFAQYNVYRVPVKEIADLSWTGLPPDLVTNFLFSRFQVASYLAAHRFAEDDYHAARGFRLTNLCIYLSAIVLLEFGQVKGSRTTKFLRLWQLYQRAYTVTPPNTYFRALRETAHMLIKDWFRTDAASFDRDAEAIREFLTLRQEKQSSISLWSHGPRFAFVPHERALLIDLNGLGIILQNAFFRIKHQQSAKGPAFEAHFRQRAVAAGLDVLPEREIRNDSGQRELDVAVRVGDTLLLCECKAMELPLDFDIGRPKTVITRVQQFDAKLDQALSAERFIRATPAGRNYDFSWATNVISMVVSPFIEWIWSRGSKTWLASETPRILSTEEALVFMKGLGT